MMDKKKLRENIGALSGICIGLLYSYGNEEGVSKVAGITEDILKEIGE